MNNLKENIEERCGRKLTSEIKQGAKDKGLSLSLGLFCENNRDKSKQESDINKILSTMFSFPNLGDK